MQRNRLKQDQRLSGPMRWSWDNGDFLGHVRNEEGFRL